MRTALTATAKRLFMIKPRPDMTDEECTPEAIIEECVIHGSPRTVLDKLVALRESVGPFGTLLQIGLDWGGPNEAWERDGMRLLAQEVMPRFRQHVTGAGGGVNNREAGTGSSMVTWCAVLQRSDATMPGPSRN